MSQLSSLIGFSVTQSSEARRLPRRTGLPWWLAAKASHCRPPPIALRAFKTCSRRRGKISPARFPPVSLGALIQARDGNIASILSSLNTLASSFGAAINKVNMAGYYANGKPGQAMFSVTAGNGAAESMSVALTDPSQIAASSARQACRQLQLDGKRRQQQSAGHDQCRRAALGELQTSTQFLSGMVFQVGNDVSQAQSETDAGSLMLQQLQDEQGSVEGVSTDEEASNLITYQQAYQAAAQVVSVVDELTLASINLGVQTAMT